MSTETELPAEIERQLESLETRHSRHARMLENHRQAKALARERHYARRHKIKIIPIHLI